MVTKKSTRKKASRKKTARKAARKKTTSRKKATKRSTTRKKAVGKTAKKAAKKRTVKKRAAKKKAVKKTAKKVAASRKKTARKATRKAARPIAGTARQRVYNLTREVPEYQYFVLANGQPVKHVAELASILDQLEDHVFNHHVTPDKNDFHNWVKDVFEDVELARKMVGVGNKKHLQLVIYKHLAGHD